MQKIGIRVTLRLSVGCALFGRANRFVGSVSANVILVSQFRGFSI